MGMMGLLRPKYARVLWVFLQIRTIEHSPDSFEQFCSGSRRKLDASRKFFQLRNQGLSKSLFSTAILLALLENLLRWREGRISPSPHDMHTLWKKMTRWPRIRGLEIEQVLHGMAVWALLTPVEIIFLSAFLTRPWEPSGQGPPNVYFCPQNLAHCSALRRCSINSHWMNKWPSYFLAYTTKSPSIGNYLFYAN